MTLLKFADARRTGSERALSEIADALLELGGSAHRDAVFERVSIHRGQGRISDDLRVELMTAFNRHCAAAARKGRPAVFHLPFGEGSRRWSLTPEFMQSLLSETAPVSTVISLPPDSASLPQPEIATAA